MRIRIIAPLAAGLFATVALVAQDAPAAGTPDGQATSLTATPGEDGPTFGGETVGPDAVPGEIALHLRDDASEADVADLDARLDLVMRPNSGWSTTHDKLEVADVDAARET